MDIQTKTRIRDGASVTLFRITTAINMAVFELTDNSAPEREVLKSLLAAQNQLAEVIAQIKRTVL